MSAHKRVSTDARTRAQRIARAEAGEVAYHQVRVLLLIVAISGKSGKLDGLTKLAKLDFLLRYPVFLEQLASDEALGIELDDQSRPTPDERLAVESRMLRYKYGPWDDRYYPIIGALVGRGLAEYVESRGRVGLRPTAGGRAIAESMAALPEWQLTALRCEVLRKAFGRTSGSQLKELIYTRLPEVVDRPHRTEI